MELLTPFTAFVIYYAIGLGIMYHTFFKFKPDADDTDEDKAEHSRFQDIINDLRNIDEMLVLLVAMIAALFWVFMIRIKFTNPWKKV